MIQEGCDPGFRRPHPVKSGETEVAYFMGKMRRILWVPRKNGYTVQEVVLGRWIYTKIKEDH
jgi:hypothetical protein